MVFKSEAIAGRQLFMLHILVHQSPMGCLVYCPTPGMEEKPSLLGDLQVKDRRIIGFEDTSEIVIYCFFRLAVGVLKLTKNCGLKARHLDP